MFIHGIGGAKYDQLTDEISLRFFQSSLPEHLTVSGTFLIQQEVAAIPTARINRLKNQLRQLRFHPEAFLKEASDIHPLVKQKASWTRKKELDRAQRQTRHQEIVRLNELMQPWVAERRLELSNEIEQLEANFDTARILNSREYSFCLHDVELLDTLKALALEIGCDHSF